MAVDSIVLEQLLHAGGGEEDLHTVLAGRRESVRIHVSVKTAAAISIKIRKGGEATADKQHITEDESVAANTSAQYPLKGTILLDAGDVVTVESDQTDTAFTINGYEDDIPT
tara:strand:- start:255 stop:590 length:336 start_codon:yes stop_codon:yes gene_type:complete